MYIAAHGCTIFGFAPGTLSAMLVNRVRPLGHLSLVSMSAHPIAVLTFPFDLDATFNHNPVTRPGTRLVRFSLLAAKALTLLEPDPRTSSKAFLPIIHAHTDLCSRFVAQFQHRAYMKYAKPHLQGVCSAPTYGQSPGTS